MRVRTMLPLAAAAAALLAQGPAGPGPMPPPADELKTYLGLTDIQVQTLQQIRRQESEALRSVYQEMREKQRSLQDQIRNGSNDAASLGRLLLDTEALRKRAAETQKGFRDQALNALNADQKTKLSGLEQAQKLAPTIQQAGALGLLAPPAGAPDGPGFGGPGPRPMGRPGPSGFRPRN